MTKRALVIGAVLLDAIGTPNENQEKSNDKIGDVSLSVGGVAFNVAVNLRCFGVRTNLITGLKKNSPVSSIIKKYLSQNGVGTGYIFEEEDAREAIYISIESTRDSSERITSSPIQEVSIFEGNKINNAILRSDIVIADTNITYQQLFFLKQKCSELGRPLCVVVASDAKASRVVEANCREHRYRMVSMNIEEAKKINITIPDPISSTAPDPGIDDDIVNITCGENGAHVHSAGRWNYIQPPHMSGNIVNRSGAGDVLFSFACRCIVDGTDILGIKQSEEMRQYVARILRSKNANLGGGKISLGSKNKSEFMSGFTLMALSVVIIYFGLSKYSMNSIPAHLITSFTAAGIFGATGAWLKSYLDLDGDISLKHPISVNAVAGFLVGLLTAIIGSLPSLAELLLPETPSVSVMTFHFIACIVIGTASGLALAKSLEELVKRGLSA